MLVAMFSLDWRMALVAMAIFPAVLVVMVIYQRYSTPIVRAACGHIWRTSMMASMKSLTA